MSEFKLADYSRRMDGAVKSLQSELAGLRTGRASAGLLDPVVVDMYGSRMPLNQLGVVNVPEPRMLTVTVWDRDSIKAVEKAIANAGLGLNPQSDGNLIRVPVPDLSEERRKELVKVAAKYAEQGRVAVRNVRRDAMDHLKKAQKDGHISEDEQKKLGDDVQKETDKHIAQMDELLKQKEKDILTV